MLYTNRSLEIINDDKGRRRLEILNMYGKSVSILIDNRVSENLISVEGKFHKLLSLSENDKGELMLVSDKNKKDKDLYIVLDLLDYKCFQRNSVLLTLKGDVGFETMRYYRSTNRCNRCKWGLHILKAPKRTFSILRIYTTSGKEKYLTIYKKFVMLHSEESVKEYIKEHNIDFDFNDSLEWELLKRKK